MDIEILENLSEILDTEIKSYEELRDLYIEKKKVLIAAKPEELAPIDEKIMTIYGNILNLDKKRTKISDKLGLDEVNMTNLIALVDGVSDELKEKFQTQKVKINEVSNELMLLNQRNVELIKHGLIISDRMLNTIVNAFTPQASLYDGSGKNKENDSTSISTVIKDA